MAEKDLEKIIQDLKGISVFEHNSKLISHIKTIQEYPQEGIFAVFYDSRISREWSSDDEVPGGGAGDWYECETITKKYLFIENASGSFQEMRLSSLSYSRIVDDVKKQLENEGHKISYIIKRETVEGPNWGWFDDTIYTVKC